MIDKIKEHIEEAKAFNTKRKEALEQFRIKYLGSKGLLKDQVRKRYEEQSNP